MRRIALVPLIVLVLAVAVVAGFRVTGAQQQRVALADMAQDSGQWVMPAQNYAAERHSALAEIKTDNVGELKAAWTMSTGATRGHEGQPLVIGDTLYFESAYPNHVFAVDLNDYHIKWQYTPKQDSFAVSVACCDLVNRGVGYGDGKIIVDALDGQVIALDINTGKPVWTVHNSDPSMGQTLTSAPLIVKEKYAIVGVSGGEFGVRGYLTAYDLHNGKRIWRAYSEGPDSDTRIGAGFTGPKNAGIKTWTGEQWKVGGGTTWGWYSYDPALNLIYYGTGNPGTWNPSQRPGDNKWSMTIFARDADTGMAKWAYQMTPHDAWDYDGVNEMILADIKINGQTGAGARPLRPQRFRLRARSPQRQAAAGEEVRPVGELGVAHRHDDGPPRSRPALLHQSGRQRHRASARRRWATKISSPRRSIRRPATSSYRRTTIAWTTKPSRSSTRAGSRSSARS